MKRKASGATERRLIVGSGDFGQATVDDAPGYKCINTKKKPKKGLLFISAPGTKSAAVEGFATLPFHPQWISAHPHNGLIYAAGDDDKLHAVSIDPQTLRATVLSSMDSLGGSAFVEISSDGRFALCANYGSGVLCVLPIAEDGSIGPPSDSKQPWPLEGLDPALEDRQEACHPHQVVLEPAAGKWALACDLGADRVWVYEFDTVRGALIGAINSDRHLRLPPGSGPRHLAFHPNGRVVYVLCELSGKLVTCGWDAAAGRLHVLESLGVMPKGVRCLRAHHSGLSHIAVTPDGSTVYAASRTDNQLVRFTANPKTGKLSLASRESTQGVCPRHFYVDDERLIICNQDTQTLRVASGGGALLDAQGICPNCIIDWAPQQAAAGSERAPAPKKAKKGK